MTAQAMQKCACGACAARARGRSSGGGAHAPRALSRAAEISATQCIAELVLQHVELPRTHASGQLGWPSSLVGLDERVMAAGQLQLA